MIAQAAFQNEISQGPSNGSAYWIQADDGVRLRMGVWLPEGSCKGSVLFFPGRTEYIEKYGRIAQAFGNQGFASCVIDWRGQGMSDRLADDTMVSHVEKFSDYYRDVSSMVSAAAELDLPRPWFLVGHSMGACIGLGALIDGLDVKASAFTAPMWGIHLSTVERLAAWPLTWVAKALGKGSAYAPGNKAQVGQCYVLSVPFEGNRLTSDSEMFEYMVDQAKALPELQTGAPSMGWLYETLKEARRLSSMPSPAVPSVVFCGDNEVLVDVSAIERRMNKWPNGSYNFVEGAHHDIFSELPEIRMPVVDQISGLFHGALQR